ncbi:MAG: YdcF family protein [Burkholderiaceae bacterium]
MLSSEFAFELKQLTALLLLPPTGPILCVVLGLCLLRGAPRLGRVLVGLGVVAALVLSTPLVGHRLMRTVEAAAGAAPDERELRALMAAADAPKAIVILAGGMRGDERERPYREQPNWLSLERLMHGVWVAKVTGLPILISGGTPIGRQVSESALMKRTLEQQFGMRATWIEERSLDTAGNARYSAELLLPQGRERVLLVTHAYHMPRALAAFQRAGFRPLPAPFGYLGMPTSPPRYGWMPSTWGMQLNWLALHESLGELWYRLRGYH